MEWRVREETVKDLKKEQRGREEGRKRKHGRKRMKGGNDRREREAT